MGKTLMLGKIEGRRRVRQRMRLLDPIDMSLSKPRETVRDREAWCAAVYRVVKRQTRLGDRTTSHPTSLPPCTPIHKESKMLFRVISSLILSYKYTYPDTTPYPCLLHFLSLLTYVMPPRLHSACCTLTASAFPAS